MWSRTVFLRGLRGETNSGYTKCKVRAIGLCTFFIFTLFLSFSGNITGQTLDQYKWPGSRRDGTQVNSSTISIGENLQLEWTYPMYPQNLNRLSYGNPYLGSVRSKNLAIRDGEVAVLMSRDDLRTATWNFSVPQEGYYNLYTWHTSSISRPSEHGDNGTTNDKNRARNTPFTITDEAGTITVPVRQHSRPSQWIDLAESRHFLAATDYSVTVSTDGANGVVVFDAIMASSAPLIFKDDYYEGGEQFVGTWDKYYRTIPGYYGYSCRRDNKELGQQATWDFTVPDDGDYELYVWYVPSVDNATNAPFTINFEGGSETVLVNQQINGLQWVKLGTSYNFLRDNTYSVTLSNDGADGYVIFDVLKISPVGTEEFYFDNKDPANTRTGEWLSAPDDVGNFYGDDYLFAGKQYFGFLDADTGQLNRYFETPNLYHSGGADFNRTGVEGRDLREGQFLTYWHANGNIYGHSSGDGSWSEGYNASDGSSVLVSIGKDMTVGAYNQSGYFTMNDNSDWYFMSYGGHSGYRSGVNKWIQAGNIVGGYGGYGALHLGSGGSPSLRWSAPFLLDGDRLYVLGRTGHPDLDLNVPYPAYGWLGAQVRAFTIIEEDSKPKFVDSDNDGEIIDFIWEETDAYVMNESEVNTAPKAYCLGKNDIYLVYQGGVSHTDIDATVDFSQPLVLTGIDRNNGAAWNMDLGITGIGAVKGYSSITYSNQQTFYPQISYIDRTQDGGSEIVAVMLPEAVKINSWGGCPTFDPYETHPDFNTRISVVDVVSRQELWNYEYEHNETTPVWGFGCTTNTRMIVAGNSLYVCYVKSFSPLSNYINTEKEHDLYLYVDEFDLTGISKGERTSYAYSLGVRGNTIMLDDLAAVDGKLYALITYRVWCKDLIDANGEPLYEGGGQLVACVTSSQSYNNPPVANDDSYSILENTTIDIYKSDLLYNDTDEDGDLLTFSGFTKTSYGDLTDNGDGTLTYTPNQYFVGTDNFIYSIIDEWGGTSNAVVHIVVEDVNDIPQAWDDLYSTIINTDLIIPIDGLLSNDTDRDGDPLTFTGFSQAAIGVVTDNFDGTLTYAPDPDFLGTDTFSYSITDGRGGTSSATVHITVALNEPPLAVDDSAFTYINEAKLIDVLDNDTDPEGYPLVVTEFTQGAHGTVTESTNGVLEYQPEAGYLGVDTFSYIIIDGKGGSDTAEVKIKVLLEGDLLGWGANRSGQLGDGTNVTRYSPVFADLAGVIGVSSSYNSSIGLKSDGTVWEWGGQMDVAGTAENGDTTDKPADMPVNPPTQVLGLTDVIGVAAGGSANLALKSDGAVWYWSTSSGNDDGTTGSTATSTPEQILGLENIIEIATSDGRNLALKIDGTAWEWTWLYNEWPILSYSTPQQVTGLNDIEHIATGGYHCLALRSDGIVWAWGSNWSGELGDGTMNSSDTPVQVLNLEGVINIAAGGNHSLALRSDGTVWIWGASFESLLGGILAGPMLLPEQVEGLAEVISISVGYSHALALRSDETVWAWGSNYSGQLGNGTQTPSDIPAIVPGLRAIKGIAAGPEFSFAIIGEVVPGANRPPVLDPIGNRSVEEDTLLEITLTASDPDGDTFAYSATNLPEGSNFIDDRFSWTPTHNDIGEYIVIFIVSDNELEDYEEVTITVTEIPVISIELNNAAWQPGPIAFGAVSRNMSTPSETPPYAAQVVTSRSSGNIGIDIGYVSWQGYSPGSNGPGDGIFAVKLYEDGYTGGAYLPGPDPNGVVYMVPITDNLAPNASKQIPLGLFAPTKGDPDTGLTVVLEMRAYPIIIENSPGN